MINFRFHIVSLTAVFLALAAGIGVGAAVVDRATVSLLETQLDQVEARRDRTNGENTELRAALGRWDEFSRQAGDQIVEGRLRGVPVLIVSFQGADRAVVSALRQATVTAGATLEGVLWLTAKWRLAEPGQTQELAAIIGAPAGEERPEVVRRLALSRLASSWVDVERMSFLANLQAAAFVVYEAPASPPAQLGSLPLAGTRFAVVSGEGAEVPNEQLAIPLTELLARSGALPILAAEPAGPVAPKPEDPPTFVSHLRANGEVSALMSTVDNLEDFRGRMAAVLAIDLLGDARTGHFGVRPDAQRLVPEPSP